MASSEGKYRKRLSLRVLSISGNTTKKSIRQTDTITSLGPSSPTESTSSHWTKPFIPSSPSSSTLQLHPPLSPTFSIFSHSLMNPNAPLSNEAIPLTVNELNATEKAMLVKKNRKLSRMFGSDLPVIQQQQTRSVTNGSTTSFHRRSVSSVSTAESRASRVRYPSVRRVPSESSLDHQSDQPVPPLPTSSTPSSDSSKTPVSLSFEQPTSSLRGRTRLQPSSDELRTRKSLDTLHSPGRSLSTGSSQSLKRTRSNISRKKPPTSHTEPSSPSEIARDKVPIPRVHVKKYGPFGAEGKATVDKTPAVSPSLSTRFTVNELSTSVEESESPSPPDEETPADLPLHTTAVPRKEVEADVQSILSTADSIGGESLYSLSPQGRDSFNSHESPQSRSDFEERRRRVAKLAQFFGVEYHDISTTSEFVAAPVYRPPSPVPTPHSLSTVQVDIRVKGRRFWGGHNSQDEYWRCRDADMNEVIDKLRDLKA